MLMMPVGLPLWHGLSLPRRRQAIHDAGPGNRRRLCMQLRRLLPVLRRLARNCHCSLPVGRRQSRFSLQVWCQCSVLRLFSLQVSHSWAQLRILAAARDAQLLPVHAGELGDAQLLRLHADAQGQPELLQWGRGQRLRGGKPGQGRA